MRFTIVSWIWQFVKSLLGFLAKFVCRRQKSQTKKLDEDNGPISITIGQNDPSINNGILPREFMNQTNQFTTQNVLKEDTGETFVDWNEWKDNTNNGVFMEQGETATMNDDVNIFEDMEPVLTRPKMVRMAKSTNGSNSNEQFQSRLHMDNVQMQFQAELGTWEEPSGGWDDDVLQDSEVSEETRNILLEKRKADKQKRAMEQRKKREERILRSEKKPHLGMKVTY